MLSTRAQVESKRAQSSTYDAVRRIVQREGVIGLYSGLDSALFGISVTNFVYYYCDYLSLFQPGRWLGLGITSWQRFCPGYEWTRGFFEGAAIRSSRASKKLTTIESMTAGAIAGSATVLITNPIWVVNTRMTARQSGPSSSNLPTSSTTSDKPTRKSSSFATLMRLFQTEGPTALFAGVLPALILVINPILQYTIFEQLKDVLEKRRRVTPHDAFFLGAIGKLLATSITYPYITVKSKMHMASRDGPRDGMMQSLKRVVREEGWSGLYKGIVPKVTQSVITAAFLFAFKDALYHMSVQARRKISAKLPGKWEMYQRPVSTYDITLLIPTPIEVW